MRRRAASAALRRHELEAERAERRAAEGGEGGGSGGGGSESGRPTRQPRVHRPGCMCIICTQGRAARGGAGALDGAGLLLASLAEGEGGYGGGGGGYGHYYGRGPGGRGPGVRYGKRAFIRAVPHVVAGLRRHK